MSIGESPEHDPDGFFDPKDVKSASRELEALFAAPVDKSPAAADRPSKGEVADTEDALQALLDRELETLFAAPDPDEDSPPDDSDARIVRPGDLLPEDGDDLALDDDAADAGDLQDTEIELEPLGEDFEALFADTPAPETALEADAEPAPASDPHTASDAATPAPQAKGPSERAAPPSRKARHQRQRDELSRVMHRTAKPRRRWRAWLFWGVVLAALAYVAFLPYDFEVGGEFTVQSGKISQVRSRTDGEIVKVLVAEGDWVETDQVMAELSNWDEKRSIAQREAEIQRLKAELQTLLDGARPEEIALKQQELTSRELMVQFAQAELERAEQLYETGATPKTVVDDRRDKLLLAESEREAARIALDLLKSGARESDIAAVRAQITQQENELEYAKLQLEQTLIRAVTNGQVVSDLSQKPIGSYLPEGGLFAELEDNRVVFANIDVPETEIEEVERGAEAELRLWSDSETRLEGTVYRVAPKAEERDFGKVIRVTVEVPNPDGRLSSGMTGYAKIAAEERPVWQAFTRMIVLFFKIELWSWLP